MILLRAIEMFFGLFQIPFCGYSEDEDWAKLGHQPLHG
jgi:hypothetical protein